MQFPILNEIFILYCVLQLPSLRECRNHAQYTHKKGFLYACKLCHLCCRCHSQEMFSMCVGQDYLDVCVCVCECVKYVWSMCFTYLIGEAQDGFPWIPRKPPLLGYSACYVVPAADPTSPAGADRTMSPEHGTRFHSTQFRCVDRADFFCFTTFKKCLIEIINK